MLVAADTSPYTTGWQLDPAFAKIIGIDPDSKPGLDNSNYGVDLNSNIDFGGAKLTSITAYNRMIRREYSDWDATQYYDSDEYFRSYLNVISEEARIASTGTRPLLLGGRGVLLGSASRRKFLFRFHSTRSAASHSRSMARRPTRSVNSGKSTIDSTMRSS